MVGRLLAPKDVPIPVPQIHGHVIVHGKKAFVDMMKSFRWGGYSGFFLIQEQEIKTYVENELEMFIPTPSLPPNI